MMRKTIWNERFGMLMASGSPGSAIAYELGSSVSKPILTHSKIDADGSPAAMPSDPPPAAGMRFWRALKAWLRDTADRFAESSWNREMRQIESYLAQAQDTADLEHRMRRLHENLLSRARTLR
jgi:hypothetical protein